MRTISAGLLMLKSDLYRVFLASSKRLVAVACLCLLGHFAVGSALAQDIKLQPGTFQIGPLKFQIGPPEPPTPPTQQGTENAQQAANQGGQQQPAVRRPQRFDPLFEPFAADQLNRAEQRALQFALTHKGHYQGLMDGSWGRMSQAALTRYTQAEFSQDPINLHIVQLSSEMQDEMRRNGWRYISDNRTRYNFLLPLALINADPQRGAQANMLVWAGNKSSLNVSTRVENTNLVRNGHARLLAGHRGKEAPLNVRRDNRFITAILDRRGVHTYVRSEEAGGRWRTIVITARAEDKSLFDMVAGSIASGNRPGIGVRSGSYLHQLTDLATEYAAYTPPVSDPALNNPGANNQGVGTQFPDALALSTGIFINDEGYVLATISALKACNYVLANGYNMSPKVVFDDLNIAILKPDEQVYNISPIAFSQIPAEVNQRIMIATGANGGYLGDKLDISRGIIKSKINSQGNPFMMQVDAQLPDDANGAPFVTRSGLLLGIKTNSGRSQTASTSWQATDHDVVKADLIKLLLDSYDIAYRLSDARQPMGAWQLETHMAGAMVSVECVK